MREHERLVIIGGGPGGCRPLALPTNVFAVGDMAQAFNQSAGRHLSVEHWGDALEHGRVAGTVIAGGEAAWSMAPGFWSTIGGKTLKYWAWGDGWDEKRFSDKDESFTVWYGRQGTLVGVLAHGSDEDYEEGRELIESGASFRAVTLPPPHPALRICIVVPARNEEELIGSCLQALAEQEQVSCKEYEILLVLDRCTDGTETRARDVAASYPALRLYFLDGPGKGSGHARRVGMEAACDRLHTVGRPHALISSTDADTVVAPDWIAVQLAAAECGARAIGGRIELADDGTMPEALLAWHLTRGASRYRKLLSEPEPSGRTEHWQFSGASMALTAAVYQKVGGLERRYVLEDEQLERVLRRHGVPIERLLSVRVTTSARLVGRAGRGLAHDLSAAAKTLKVDEWRRW